MEGLLLQLLGNTPTLAAVLLLYFHGVNMIKDVRHEIDLVDKTGCSFKKGKSKCQ